ncbi:dna methyltransferase 1 associated protein 1 [Echinococcus multilocularis]|uniref:Dna methyltransferase 1 associated protein 1 n=1 Tax=Echinococcus multilocularis TaxID=6211 RepID=A0A068YG35_ECHMU|nr:dna methyltransferase 1 associated protein 1 [Echinococcus multilocularis]
MAGNDGVQWNYGIGSSWRDMRLFVSREQHLPPPHTSQHLFRTAYHLTVCLFALLLQSISANLAFPDLSKTPGVHLNSQGMKLPASLGQKRIRVIENFLSHYQMGECGDCGPVLRWQFISTLLVQPKWQ